MNPPFCPIEVFGLVVLLVAVAPLRSLAEDSGIDSTNVRPTETTRPFIPGPKANENVVVDPSVPDDFDASGIRECIGRFSSAPLAEYRAYLFSTAPGTRLEDLYSIGVFAQRAYRWFAGDGWFDSPRGVLLAFDLSQRETAVIVGERWDEDGPAPKPALSPLIRSQSPTETICTLLKHADDKLLSDLTIGELDGPKDYRAGLNLLEDDLDRLKTRFRKARSHAEQLVGPEKPLVQHVEDELPTKEHRKLVRWVNDKRRHLDRRIEESPEEVRVMLDDGKDRVRQLHYKTNDAEAISNEYRMVGEDLEQPSRRLRELEERLDNRRQESLLLFGANDVSRKLDECRRFKDELAKRHAAVKSVDYQKITRMKACLDDAETALKETAPFDKWLPGLLAALAALTVVLLGYLRSRTD